MRSTHILARLAAVTTLLAAGPAAAQLCAGFTDVPAGSQFCPNVEWVKNRAITVGCTSTTVYCPSAAVSREQMAAFLNRLGTALTPVDLPVVAAAGTVVAPNNLPVLCATAPYDVTGFPRRAYVNAAAILSSPSANVDVRATIVYSTNGGANWTSVGNSDQYGTLYTGATPPNHVTLTPFGSVDLTVGQSVAFGVEIDQVGAGAVTLTAACHNRVQIWNRNASTPPLDAQVTNGGRRRGG